MPLIEVRASRSRPCRGPAALIRLYPSARSNPVCCVSPVGNLKAQQPPVPVPPVAPGKPDLPPIPTPPASRLTVQPAFSVVIDAAHGGANTGARIAANSLEKDITLALSTPSSRRAHRPRHHRGDDSRFRHRPAVQPTSRHREPRARLRLPDSSRHSNRRRSPPLYLISRTGRPSCFGLRELRRHRAWFRGKPRRPPG